MKHLLVVCALLAATSANAASIGGGKHGNHSGAGFGPAGGQHASGQEAAAGVGSVGAGQTGGNGGQYSFADNYQPWPQSGMEQFAKPAFVPYTGE
jgi:hypothetical protein